MKTLDLTQPTDIPTATPRPKPAPARRVAADAEPSFEQKTVGGLSWTCRNGFARFVEDAPSGVWSDPDGQDWTRVKRNSTREVWRASLAGRLFYVKYYFGDSLAAALKRMLRGAPCRAEWRSGIYALEAGIPAVRPAGFTQTLTARGRTCSMLVTEALDPAQPLNEFWKAIDSDTDAPRRRRDIAALTDRLAEMIARAHQAGFEHLDMHAANILVQTTAPRTYRTAFVDLQSAKLGVPVSDAAIVRNLAQLNQWFRRNSSLFDRLRFLRAYLRWRNEFEAAFEHSRPATLSLGEMFRALVKASDRHARQLWERRDRRALRSGRYFARITLPGGWRGMTYVSCKHPTSESLASRLELDSAWWRSRLDKPLRWFENGRPCKHSHTATVTRALLPSTDGSIPVILKRPLAGNWRRRARRLLGASRARRGWKNGYALLNRDIPTARPLACLDRRIGPLVRDSLLITEAIPGAEDLEAYLRTEFAQRSASDWLAHKKQLIELLVRRVRRLQDRGFTHRDCKAQNLLVARHPKLQVLWIDMDGLAHAKRLTRRQLLRPLMRLHVSLLDVPGLTRTDRLRFLRRYLARFGSDPRAWRSLWRTLDRAAARKLRRLTDRRAWKLAHYGRV